MKSTKQLQNCLNNEIEVNLEKDGQLTGEFSNDPLPYLKILSNSSDIQRHVFHRHEFSCIHTNFHALVFLRMMMMASTASYYFFSSCFFRIRPNICSMKAKKVKTKS